MSENEQIPITDEDIKRVMLEFYANANDIDYMEVIETIAQEDPVIVLPIITQVLFDEGRTMSKSEWAFRAEDICNNLGRPELRHLAEPMIPALITVIDSRYDERGIDPMFVIDTLKQFDLRPFPWAILVLLNWIQRTDSWRSDETKDAWKIIQQFDAATLLPYRLIIQSIQENLPHMIG
jgi:hypothetical protein